MLLVGSVVMFVSMVVVGIIVAKFHHDWPSHEVAGWVAVGKEFFPKNLTTNILLTDPGSTYLGLYRRVRCNMGPSIMDADLRDLPSLHPC